MRVNSEVSVLRRRRKALAFSRLARRVAGRLHRFQVLAPGGNPLPPREAGGGRPRPVGGTGAFGVGPRETPITNLCLSMLERLGVEVESFGDSTGRLPDLA
jgi:hypothetical protein